MQNTLMSYSTPDCNDKAEWSQSCSVLACFFRLPVIHLQVVKICEAAACAAWQPCLCCLLRWSPSHRPPPVQERLKG